MKIEELVSGKKDQEEINLDGTAIPSTALKKLLERGYIHLKSYKENKTFVFWGKTCSACFTKEDLLKML